MFAMGELATVAQERIPITIVVVDDGGYGMLRYGREGDPDHGSDLLGPDFGALAAAFSIPATSLDGVGAAYEDALAEAVASGEPHLLARTSPASSRPAPPRRVGR